MHPGYLFLLNEASEAVDYQQRMKILCEAEKLLIEQMPIAPLFYQRATCLKKTYVQGVVVPPAGPPDFKSSHISH
jgi:ABC-type transport system substrate-binding protein